MRKYHGIARQFVRIGWIRKSQFRWEFFNQVLMDVLFYTSHVLLFEILFGMGEGLSIAGWERADVRVYLGMVFVHDAFAMTCLGQAWHFGDDLKKGNLDSLRIRPAHPVFLYFFQRFSPEGLSNLVIASAYLGWSLFQAGLGPSVALAGHLLWAVGLAFWTQTILHVLYSCAEFWLTDSDLGRFLDETLGTLGDRPIDIYGRRVRLFLLLLLPVGALAWLPASLLLGRLSAWSGLFHSVWIVVLGWAIFRLWRCGFRRYESAMG